MIYYNIESYKYEVTMELNELKKILKALSNDARLKIFMMLKDKKLCAYHLLDKLNVTQPTLSHHMKVLCDCGLVIAEKDWKWTYYSQNKTKIKEVEYFLSTLI